SPSLVTAANAVVIHGNGIEVEMGECFPEVPGRYAGHSHASQGFDFMKTYLQKFGVGDGIDIRVVGPSAVPGHKHGRAFVQIVHNGRVPFMKHTMNGLGGFMTLLMCVAIDVAERVLSPVGR